MITNVIAIDDLPFFELYRKVCLKHLLYCLGRKSGRRGIYIAASDKPFGQAAVGRKCLTYDLVHIVVAISGQPTNKGHTGFA
jgi:hypothetical protein